MHENPSSFSSILLVLFTAYGIRPNEKFSGFVRVKTKKAPGLHNEATRYLTKIFVIFRKLLLAIAASSFRLPQYGRLRRLR
jgi:hypothetical protein